MQAEVMVSVFCATYNHEKYIRKALEGFVAQKTTFSFEVLINDDASTDRTADIIREYEKKYPNIIKAIYQRENQYSQEISIIRRFLLPIARGIYFAYCEGDDFWIDPLKLQKQFDYMEKHPECSLCAHRAVWNSIIPGDEGQRLFPEQDWARDYSTEEIIGHGGLIFSTNSIFLRRETYETFPNSFLMSWVDDYPLMIYASMCGKCHCMQDVMSVYNRGVEGSYTAKFLANREFRIQQNLSRIEMFRNIDKYSNYRYTKALQKRIRHSEYHIYKHTGEIKNSLRPEYEEFRLEDEAKTAQRKVKLAQAGKEPNG